IAVSCMSRLALGIFRSVRRCRAAEAGAADSGGPYQHPAATHGGRLGDFRRSGHGNQTRANGERSRPAAKIASAMEQAGSRRVAGFRGRPRLQLASPTHWEVVMVDVALRVTLSLSCLWAVLLASSLAWGQATSTPRNGLPSASGQQLPAPNLTVPEQTYPCNPGSYVPSDNAGAPELAPQ